MAFGKLGAGLGRLGRLGASKPWTPLSLGSALVGWYDAGVGVYKDAGTTLAVNNDTVQQWKDQSGNSRHLNQATAGKRPTYKTAGLNGKKSVTFSAAAATAMFAQSFPLSAGSGFSAVAVARMNSATENYGRLVAYVSNTDGAGTGNDFTGANNGVILARQGTNNTFTGFRDGDLGFVAGYNAVPYRFGVTHDGTTFKSHLNNQFGDVFTGQATAISMCAAGTGTLQIGGALQVIGGVVQALSGNSWDGPLSELVIVNRALTTQEQASLDYYLSNKWGMYVPALSGKNVIFDTDNDADVGDASALQTLIALAKAGECNIAAVLVNSRNNMAAECARTILAANGYGSVPIGAFKGTTPTTISNVDPYCTTVVARFGVPAAGRATYPDAVTVFRQALANMADGSGIYVSVGYGPNFAALLASAGDGIDARTGPVLFAAKIARCVIQAGNYDSTNAEYNAAGDPADWNAVVAAKPATVPTYYFGGDWFSSVLMHPSATANPLTSPAYYAATLAGDNQGGGIFTRPGWDGEAMLWAVRGDASGVQVFGLKGAVAINGTTGVTTFTGSSEAGIDSYLYWGGSGGSNAANSATISATLNALIAPVQ